MKKSHSNNKINQLFILLLIFNMFLFLTLITPLRANNSMPVNSISVKTDYNISLIMSIDYGTGPYRIGYANGPKHTPYAESAQSIIVSKNLIIILDTFNKRLLKFSIENKTNAGFIVPQVDMDKTFYTGFAEIPSRGFVFFDALNTALILTDPEGKIFPANPKIPFLSHITRIYATPQGMLVAGDKGVGQKGIHIFNHLLDHISGLKAEGLTEAAFSVDTKERIHIMVPRVKNEDPVFQIYGAASENSETASYSRLFSKSLKGCSFPQGPCNIAGIDAKGNYYLYWAGLAHYFGPEYKNLLTPEIRKLPFTQMIALFNVFSPSGKMISHFIVPFSTAPESAWVTPDGTVFVMAYDAESAPKGKVNIYKCSTSL